MTRKFRCGIVLVLALTCGFSPAIAGEPRADRARGLVLLAGDDPRRGRQAPPRQAASSRIAPCARR